MTLFHLLNFFKMRTFYPNNSRHNKAAVILASMSPDMVEDIVALLNARGSAVVSDVFSANDGPARPLAAFSRNYIADEDFPDTYQGFTTVMLADLRTLKGDHDFYEDTLTKAFSLPADMADAIATSIETTDVLGKVAPNGKALPWYKRLYNRVAEDIRRVSNWSTSVLHLPWENDQDQQFDIDYLYELSKLGKVVDELNRRARLIKAQAAISSGMQIWEGGDAEVYGDTEASIVRAYAPALNRTVPRALYGGTEALAKQGHYNTIGHTMGMIDRAHGKMSQLAGAGDAQTSEIKEKTGALANGGGSPLLALLGPLAGKKAFLQGLASLIGAGQSGDAEVYGDVSDTYGDAVANAMATGDVPGVYRALQELSGSHITTGDAQLDQAIIGDVLGELAAEKGDALDDREVGGLFTRWKINAALKKGARRRRRGAKRAALRKAKTYSNYTDEIPTEEDYGAGSAGGGEQSSDSEGGGEYVNYNLDSFPTT